MRQPPKLEAYAIMVVDMIGYSQRLAQHPVATHMAFQTHLHDVFESAIRARDGRVIKTTGDGVVAIFKDPNQADRSAHEIQLRLKSAASSAVFSNPIKYRIALHYGTIVIERHDIFGLDVNIAIHMQQLAPPGGVCISNALFLLLSEQRRKTYRYLGEKYLKNIPYLIRIYAHDPTPPSDPRAGGHRASPPRRTYLSPPPRLAVAEFETVVETDSQRVLAAMAHDCLSRGLSRFADTLRVVPIGTSMTRVVSEATAFRQLISNDMACEYLLHGICLVRPDTLNLMVHLESLSKQELLWATKIGIDLKNQIDLTDDRILTEVVTAIVIYLEKAESDLSGMGRYPEDEILFRQAKRLMAQRTLDSLEQAKQLLSNILVRSGEIGDVHIALARAENNHGHLLAGDGFVESLDRAREHAKMAIAIDDLNPHAHAELALQEMFLKRHDSAVDLYQHALRLNPYDPMLRADWADCLANTGRPQEGLEILEEILSGWPRDRAWVEWGLCDAYWALNQPDRMLPLLHRHPDQPHVHRNLTACYAKLGQIPDARRHAELVRRHQPDFSARTWRKVMPNINNDDSDEFVDFLEMAGL